MFHLGKTIKFLIIEAVAHESSRLLKPRIWRAELQKSCGHAGITREEGLPYVRSVRRGLVVEHSTQH